MGRVVPPPSVAGKLGGVRSSVVTTRPMLIEFDPPARPISMNDGDSWDDRRLKQLWRDRAFWAWVEAHPGVGPAGRRFPPASVYVSIPFPKRRRRDPINFARTVKHIVDGIQLAGAWPDDTPEWVEQNVPTLVIGSGPVIVRVVPREG